MEDLLSKEHSSWKAVLTPPPPPSIDNPSSYMDYPTPHFYKENFNPPSMIFQKSQSVKINKAQTKNLLKTVQLT